MPNTESLHDLGSGRRGSKPDNYGVITTSYNSGTAGSGTAGDLQFGLEG